MGAMNRSSNDLPDCCVSIARGSHDLLPRTRAMWRSGKAGYLANSRRVGDCLLELAERLAAEHREVLQARQRVATAGEAEAHVPRVAVARDVERLAVERNRHRIACLELRAAEVQWLLGT